MHIALVNAYDFSHMISIMVAYDYTWLHVGTLKSMFSASTMHVSTETDYWKRFW